MLSKLIKKIKPYENDVIIVVIILLVAMTSFGLGRLSKIMENKTPIQIENFGAATGGESGKVESPVIDNKNNMFVASKNGAKYYLPWCSGAQRIKDANKIWFSSKEEAEAAGYTPAANCKGLK